MVAQHIGNCIFVDYDGEHILLFNHGDRANVVSLGAREIEQLVRYIKSDPSRFGWIN